MKELSCMHLERAKDKMTAVHGGAQASEKIEKNCQANFYKKFSVQWGKLPLLLS